MCQTAFVFSLLLCLSVVGTGVVGQQPVNGRDINTSEVQDLDSVPAQDSPTAPAPTPADFHSSVPEETRAWCARVQASPEPEVLMYNMIPKTASTSVRTHIEEGGKSNVSFFMHDYSIFVHRNSKSDLDSDPKTAQKFKKITIEHLESARNESKKLFVTGHFAHHISQLATTVEAFNTMRDCRARLYSQIQFDLFTCPNAKNFKKHKPNKTDARSKWAQIMMKIDTDPIVCSGSVGCLNATYYGGFGGIGYQSRYLAGPDAVKQHGNLVDAALHNMHSFDYYKGGFTYIGITERLEETLEMLECLYPTYFPKNRKIAKEKYNARGTTKISRDFMQQASVQAFINGSGCGPGDDTLYREALRLHTAKHRAASSHPQHCCRAPALAAQ
jgi:hypothetical protein